MGDWVTLGGGILAEPRSASCNQPFSRSQNWCFLCVDKGMLMMFDEFLVLNYLFWDSLSLALQTSGGLEWGLYTSNAFVSVWLLWTWSNMHYCI